MNITLTLTKTKHVSVIDPPLLKAILTVNVLFLVEVIGLCGIAANIMNILNFRKQGYKDGVNVTLTALAISDLGALITQQIYIHILNPWSDESRFVMLKRHLLLLVIYINEYFVRVSGFVTACASFERCLCVVLPMKVKFILTRRVATVVNISIFAASIGYVVAPNSILYVGDKFVPDYNRTFAYVYYKDNRAVVMNIFYYVTALVAPNLTILMLLLFTVVLITKLKSSSKWRHRVSNPHNRAQTSMNYKERNAVAMLAIISGIYVVCLIPRSALNLAVGLVNELKVDGVYVDLTILTYTFIIIFEALNCSASSIIYFKMSSKYREIAHDMLPCWRKQW
ncbi:neuropeptides capa receptor [Biomphalaria glabrata]|nr:neuropeptides capa receptor-like [Biomphalaria glabrata]